ECGNNKKGRRGCTAAALGFVVSLYAKESPESTAAPLSQRTMRATTRARTARRAAMTGLAMARAWITGVFLLGERLSCACSGACVNAQAQQATSNKQRHGISDSGVARQIEDDCLRSGPVGTHWLQARCPADFIPHPQLQGPAQVQTVRLLAER